MRDRLIELFQGFNFVQHAGQVFTKEDAHRQLADYLLANGVIVPPCKVGSKIYMLVTKRAKLGFSPYTFIKDSRLTFLNLERVMQDFGKTVFLTKEEAEQALANMKGGEG